MMKTGIRLKGSSLCCAALGLLLALCIPLKLAAQLDRGEITGTVEDPSGAVIANARIVLTNDATGVKAQTQSTNTGTYVFDNLIAGVSATSESTQRLVDEEVRRMIDTAHQEVTSLLTEHREQLESLAQALLSNETLDGLDAYAAAGVSVSQQQPAILS